MMFVKFFVAFVSVNVFSVCQANYCEICINHTLCKYNIPGPSPECQSYESTALITSHDITQLVYKINERRHFVAMGYSKILPQAANMKKIHWSPELATFAQRWVDQCDPFTRPDREDQCRDLEISKAGQNIASIAGPAPGLNVRSFVETWFIQVLDYTGSVIYYNQSRDYKTNYFTQLIWADTESVGCGKAKFYVDERKSILERLVCNFAPKGNIHAKPVYVIGYAATQCPNNMTPDDEFKGLCVNEDHGNLRKSQTPGPPVSSLLRILDLSNKSMKHEIDPIRSNLKQINVISNISNEQRSQKTRHVFTNNTYSALKRIPPLRKQNFWKSLVNISRNDNDYLHQQERGHSHVYHGHETPKNNYGPIREDNTNQDFRRYDYTTESINLFSSDNYRKYYNQYHQCTRKMGPIKNDCTITSECATNHCTRGITQGCQQTTTSQPTFREIPFTNPVENHIVPHYLCPCTKQTCPTPPANCNCNVNCRCLNSPNPTKSNCLATPCPRIHRMQDDDFKDDTRKSGTFQYDDMLNIIVRSGNEKLNQETSSPKEIFGPSNLRINKSFKKYPPSRGYDQIQKQVKDAIDRSSYEDQDRDYLYRSFDSSIRKRRQLDDQVNPIWHMDDFNSKKLPQLKALRFTTLGNRKNRKSKKHTGSPNLPVSTEPITIKLTDTSVHNVENQHVKEKYLSFEELMHLRKFSDGYGNYEYRRKSAARTPNGTQRAVPSLAAQTSNGNQKAVPPQATILSNGNQKAVPSQAATPSNGPKKEVQESIRRAVETENKDEVTLNTPFEPKKHCTRKLTCTWTAITAIGFDGHMIVAGGGALDHGSRTPPGYVDGCTRTSTCTRDYMNRNIQTSTLPGDTNIDGGGGSGDGGEGTSDDEDYCERRSLNVKRRNLDDKEVIAVFTTQQKDYADATITADTTLPADSSTAFISNLDTVTQTKSVSEIRDCSCTEENARRKRQESSQNQFLKERSCAVDSKKDFSFGDLYYLVLNKIIKAQKGSKSYQNKGCQCNNTAKMENTSIILLFLTIPYFANVFILIKLLCK